jgi:hypothetical protein
VLLFLTVQLAAGATSASVSQTMVGVLAGAARDPGMPSAANAGKLKTLLL